MTACSKKNLGCRGGNPYYATMWLTSEGVVSGGDFPTRGKQKTCYPYPIPDKNSRDHFDSQVETPQCRTSCSESKYGIDFNKDKYYSAGDAYLIGDRFPHENGDKAQLWAQVKEEMFTKGSIMMMYAATKDHMVYQGGIWDCPPGQPNHGVKCIGYGVDPTHGNYITCVNSWNKDFGEQGLFHMKFPGNGCIDLLMGMPVEWAGKNENQYQARLAASPPAPPPPPPPGSSSRGGGKNFWKRRNWQERMEAMAKKAKEAKQQKIVGTKATKGQAEAAKQLTPQAQQRPPQQHPFARPRRGKPQNAAPQAQK